LSEKIIKPISSAGTAASSFGGPKVVRGNAYDATIDATGIIDAARDEARRIVELAGQERQAILEDARREGYEEGLQLWIAAVREANSVRDRRLDENEPELIRLALRIAQKIIGQELHLNPQATVSIVRECLQWVRRERSLTLRVSSSELDFLRERIDVLRDAAGPNRSIELTADPAIGPGGCLIESEFGVIDARLETQIRCMEEILLRAANK
jgi:type III secretion protein L